MKLTSFLNQVADFHSAFQYRQPEPRTPDLTCAATNKLRPKLLNEELHELRQAIADNNRVEQLDALCDSQYVLSGAVLAWGFRPLFESMAHYIELRKIHDMDAHLSAMFGLIAQLEISAGLMLAHQTLTGLVALQSRLQTAVFHLGFSQCFMEAFTAVHKSNMSKIWKEGDMITECLEEDDTHTPTVGGYIVKRADGKIKKPQSYSPAELGRFV